MDREPPNWGRLLRLSWISLVVVVVFLVLTLTVDAGFGSVASWVARGMFLLSAIILVHYERDRRDREDAGHTDLQDQPRRVMPSLSFVLIFIVVAVVFISLAIVTSEDVASLVFGGLFLLSVIILVLRLRRRDAI